MKTTIELPSALLERVRRAAARRRLTLRAVVETALRDFLSKCEREEASFAPKNGSVGGQGLAPGIREGDWTQVQALIYEARGS